MVTNEVNAACAVEVNLAGIVCQVQHLPVVENPPCFLVLRRIPTVILSDVRLGNVVEARRTKLVGVLLSRFALRAINHRVVQIAGHSLGHR